MSGLAEFSREIDVRAIDDGKPVAVAATLDECKKLAKRFDLVAIKQLEATIALVREKDRVLATGRLRARIVQACAISAEDLPVKIDEPLSFRFVPPLTGYKPDEEIEIDADDCDEIEFTGGRIDLGEAVAQSLALAIDPFLTGPRAEAARAEAGLGDAAASGPFAALAALKDQK